MTNGGGGLSFGESFPAREFRWWVPGDGVPARVCRRGISDSNFPGEAVPAVVSRRGNSSGGSGRGSRGGGGSRLGWWCE